MKCAIVLVFAVTVVTAEFIFPIGGGGGDAPKCLDVLYHGDACECAKALPYKLERPQVTEHRGAHYDYGYKVEMAHQQKPTEVKYSFDFQMERPKAPSPCRQQL